MKTALLKRLKRLEEVGPSEASLRLNGRSDTSRGYQSNILASAMS
jgi:hypothetical protein